MIRESFSGGYKAKGKRDPNQEERKPREKASDFYILPKRGPGQLRGGFGVYAEL